MVSVLSKRIPRDFNCYADFPTIGCQRPKLCCRQTVASTYTARSNRLSDIAPSVHSSVLKKTLSVLRMIHHGHSEYVSLGLLLHPTPLLLKTLAEKQVPLYVTDYPEYCRGCLLSHCCSTLISADGCITTAVLKVRALLGTDCILS
jgi:hypothetical protein